MLTPEYIYLVMQHKIPNLENSWKHSARYFPEDSDQYRGVMRLLENSDQESEDIHKNLAGIVPSEYKETIRNYTKDSSNINHVLVNGVKRHEWVDHIKSIDSMFRDDSARARGEFYTYHGSTVSPSRFFDSNNPNAGRFHSYGYLSTSTNLDIAKNFVAYTKHHLDNDMGIKYNHIGGARHILQVHLPQGSPAVSLRDHSIYPHEQEILVNRGSSFIIHDRPEEIGENTYLWKAHFLRDIK